MNLSFVNVCFGVQANFIDMILILAKRFIYKCRVQETNIAFQDFKQWVIFMQKVESTLQRVKKNLVHT